MVISKVNSSKKTRDNEHALFLDGVHKEIMNEPGIQKECTFLLVLAQ